IVAAVTGPALAVTRRSQDIPVIFCSVPDPVGVGLAKSLARPGRNATGIATLQTELVTKRLEILHAVFPRAKRIAVVATAATAANASLLKQAEQYAHQVGIRLVLIQEPSQGTGIDWLFERMAAAQAGGMT